MVSLLLCLVLGQLSNSTIEAAHLESVAQGDGLFKKWFGGNRRNDCPNGVCPRPDYQYVQPSEPFPPLKIDPIDGKPTQIPSDVDEMVPSEYRPRNQNGNCVWCAAESVFASAGYTEFEGITARAIQNGWHGAWISNLTSALDTAKIEYKSQTYGKDTAIFDYAKKEGVATYVQIDGGSHAVCLVRLDSDYAYILDNNGPARLQIWTRQRFLDRWSGQACCPLKKKDKKKDGNVFQKKPLKDVPLPRKYKDDAKPAPQPTEPVKPGPKGDPGRDGSDGKPGRDGRDGKDGVSKEYVDQRLKSQDDYLKTAIEDLKKNTKPSDNSDLVTKIALLEKQLIELKKENEILKKPTPLEASGGARIVFN